MHGEPQFVVQGDRGSVGGIDEEHPHTNAAAGEAVESGQREAAAETAKQVNETDKAIDEQVADSKAISADGDKS